MDLLSIFLNHSRNWICISIKRKAYPVPLLFEELQQMDLNKCVGFRHKKVRVRPDLNSQLSTQDKIDAAIV